MSEQDGSGRLPNDTWLGPYQLLGLLGAGGMGAVYKARDSRLDRIVAIKVLPEQFAADPQRRERFEREARAVAALNHPHICQLYDVGEAGPSPAGGPARFLVMEYLEGQSLEDRILAGPLPIAEALRIAADLADALDHAHRRGLVHRDLKPANVMLTKAGAGLAGAPHAKLLDFGISRLQAPADLPALETVTADRAPLTADGAVLGTYPYMSPEQLQGREADARSDLFAFGAVLYEMITGQRAFQGTTAATLIGAILHSDPPAVSTRSTLAPAGLDRLVSRCLAKDPDNRWQTARDLALELEWVAARPAHQDQAPRRTAATMWVAASAAASAVAAALILGLTHAGSAPADAHAIQLTFTPPKGVTLVDPRLGGPVSISPDGRLLTFVAIEPDGAQRLWVRPIDSGAARALPGTDDARFPFWSPDNRSIGFFAQKKLKRVSVAGGTPQALYDAIQPGGGTWAADGTILFSAELGFQLYRGSASGAVLTAIPADGANQERSSPWFLPDGRHYLYFGRPQEPGVYLASLDSAGAAPVLKGYRGALFAPPEYVVAIRGPSKGAEYAALFAQRLNPATFEPIGDSQLIAEPVIYSSGNARSAFSASDTGTLVYTEIENPAPRLMWFDRSGKAVEQLGGASYYDPAISPDGKTVAAARTDPDTGTPDLWLIDVARGAGPRLTYDEREDFLPVWSPDSSRIVYGAQAPRMPPNLFQKTVRDTEREELLVKAIYNSQPTSWSPNGEFVMFARRDPKNQWDLWRLAMGSGEARIETPYLRSPANEHLAEFSPDGSRVAYVSDESGRNEVYVDSFPAPGKREQVSTGGGNQPRWRGDGRELFYISPDGRMMSVPVSAAPDFAPGAPVTLFATRIFDLNGAQKGHYSRKYTVTHDGQRFLISTLDNASPGSSTTNVVLNWPARLGRR